MSNFNTEKDILKLLETKQFHLLKQELTQLNVVDIADFFESLDKENIVLLFRMLPKETAAEAFVYMSPEMQKHIIEAITDAEVAGIISELFVDDTVDLLEEMPATVVKKILNNTDPNTRSIINQILQYPQDSAGSLMTTEFIDLKKEMTVSQAFDRIRKTGVDKETIYDCYVTDPNRVFLGYVTVATLLTSDPSAVIGDIMNTNAKFAYTTDDKEDVANVCRKYDLSSIPVVDHEKRLVGIITIDDVVHVLEEENTEDMEIMGALAPSEQPYLKTSVWSHFRHRIIWLLLLMVSATLTGFIITGFEDALAVLPALTAAIPMLMDTGGNAGSQSSTLVIRGIALGEIRGRDVFKVLWIEIRVAILVGACLAAVNVARLLITNHGDWGFALTVSLSLYATVIMAKCIGCLLPIAAKKLKLDPAIMAAPLITTLVDACSLVVYFLIAKLILGV